MTIDEIVVSFNLTVEVWKKATESYIDELFKLKPSENEWTLGQVCEHLVESTKGIFFNIDKCMAGNANEKEQKTATGESVIGMNMLFNNRIQVQAHKENPPLQPGNKLVIIKAFEEIREEFILVSEKIKMSGATGKEKHIVLGFMDAKEWLQYIDIHWRHHLKQKESIEALFY